MCKKIQILGGNGLNSIQKDRKDQNLILSGSSGWARDGCCIRETPGTRHYYMDPCLITTNTWPINYKILALCVVVHRRFNKENFCSRKKTVTIMMMMIKIITMLMYLLEAFGATLMLTSPLNLLELSYSSYS